MTPSEAPKTDAELIRGCLAGDARSWDALVAQYGRLVYSIPRKLGMSDNDCDDVFQVVFGIVLRKLETLREHERLSAWLIVTTHREARRLLRRRKQHSAAELTDEHAEEDEPSAEQLDRTERQHQVRRALELIDERCRKLLTALFFATETPSYDQLARETGVPIGSIGPTRSRCFKKFEATLASLGFRQS